MLALALAFTLWAYLKSPALAWKGAENSVRMFIEILPAMLAGFLLGGMIGVLVPGEVVARWAGEDSGLRGLLVATAAGALTPGGPYVQFPLVISLWKSGMGIGPVTAYLVSWTLLGLNKTFVWEVPVLGWRYAAAKTTAALLAPLAIGALTAWLYRMLGHYFPP